MFDINNVSCLNLLEYLNVHSNMQNNTQFLWIWGTLIFRSRALDQKVALNFKYNYY